MGKAKVGVLLAGAYALGLAILAAGVLALPQGSMCRVVHSVPQQVAHAAQLVRVAVHAGTLGMKHLPTVLGPQGLGEHRGSSRYCNRVQTGDCVGRRLLPSLEALPVPVLVRVLVSEEE